VTTDATEPTPERAERAPLRASTEDWCETSPADGHAWTYTIHAGPLRIETRTCMLCRYLSVQPVAERLAAAEQALAENARLRQQRDEARDEGIAWRVRLADGLSARGLPPSTDSVAAALAELDARSAHIRSDGRYIQELVAERDALQATLDTAQNEIEALRDGLAAAGFEPSGVGTIHDALGVIHVLCQVRDEAQATLDDLRAKVRATESVLAAGGPLVPELLLEELLGAARAALDSVPTQTPDIRSVTVEGYSEHDSGVCRHSYAEGIPGKGVRQWLCTLDTGHGGDHRANTLGGKAYRTWPSVPTQTDRNEPA